MTAKRAIGTFGPEAFAFLRDLKANQDRDWFQANKPRYETFVREPMTHLVKELSAAMASRDLPLRGDPKRSVFRINRDVRFSKDKRPYKTNISATFTRDGEKMSPGLLYVHIDPEGSFAAAGFYQPEPPKIHAIRQAIADDPKGFHAMLAGLAAHHLTIEPDDDALKRHPQGFGITGDEVLDSLMRHRTLILRHALAEAEAGSDHLAKTLADFAEAAMPLLDFGWRAI